MSLGIVIKATEGLVLAAESRVTLSAKMMTNIGEQTINVNFDNATKLFTFNRPYSHIGVVTYGLATIGIRTAHSFITEFETQLPQENNLSIESFSEKLSDFYMQQWGGANQPKPEDYKGPSMTFIVCGYNEGEAYGKVYTLEIPKKPKLKEENAGNNNFGISWGGQREIVDRLLIGYDSRLLNILTQGGLLTGQSIIKAKELLKQLQLALPIQLMPLQDCINLAELFIRTTISTQQLTVGMRGCGGEIDIAIITRNNPLEFIQKKKFHSNQ